MEASFDHGPLRDEDLSLGTALVAGCSQVIGAMLGAGLSPGIRMIVDGRMIKAFLLH